MPRALPAKALALISATLALAAWYLLRVQKSMTAPVPAAVTAPAHSYLKTRKRADANPVTLRVNDVTRRARRDASSVESQMGSYCTMAPVRPRARPTFGLRWSTLLPQASAWRVARAVRVHLLQHPVQCAMIPCALPGPRRVHLVTLSPSHPRLRQTVLVLNAETAMLAFFGL